VVTLLLAVIAVAPAQTKKTSATAPKKAAAAPAPAELNFNKTLGVAKAPITIEIYTDFECPACRELYLRTLRRVIQEYVYTNKVYLVHRDYPLPMHKYSRDAARWAIAAAAFGKYDTVADALYDNQSAWVASGSIEPLVSKVLSSDEFKKVKQIVEKQTTQLEANIEKDIYQAHVNQVTQTPTMFIKNKDKTYPQAGVVQYPVFKAFLDQLLNQN
jgi:protein-disulfide isomerase